MESMTQSNPEFLETSRKMFLQFEYEPHGFPLKEFETIEEAMASLDELCKRSAERKRDKCQMLGKVLHDEKFCEQIMLVLKKLEELEFHITNLRCFLEKTTEKTLTEESAKQVSELYNRLNYAIYAACGSEDVHMIKSVTAMAEATRGMSYHMQRHCWGDDIWDDMMDEHFPYGLPSSGYSSDDNYSDW
jgi:flagellin-specific chaperone FliS